MLRDEAVKLVELTRGKSVIRREHDRIEPELSLIFSGFDLNVWRFLPSLLKK
jgi:hypothetical protein